MAEISLGHIISQEVIGEPPLTRLTYVQNDKTDLLDIPYTSQKLIGLEVFQNGHSHVFKKPPWASDIIGYTLGINETSQFLFSNVRLQPQQKTLSENMIRELGFVQIEHHKKLYVGQITRLIRGYRMDGYVSLIGDESPNTPVFQDAPVRLASEEIVYEKLKMDESGYFLGKIWKTNLQLKIPPHCLEDGLTGQGGKDQGKSYLLRVLSEESALHDRAVLLIDKFGDQYYKFPNDDKKLVSDWNLQPRSFKNLFVSFGDDPFTDILLQNDLLIEEEYEDKKGNLQKRIIENPDSILDNEEFYKAILRPSWITSLSIKMLNNEEQVIAVKKIANKLHTLGKKTEIPDVLVGIDEGQNFGGEGRKKSKQVSHDPLQVLSTEAGHIGITLVILGQRQAFMSKDITAHNYVYVSYRVHHDADMKQLPKTMQQFESLIVKLPVGVALVQGLLPTLPLTVLQVRPSMSKHFRQIKNLKEFAKAYLPYKPDEETKKFADEVRAAMGAG